MANAVGTRVQALQLKETTYGVTPASPAMKVLRLKGMTPELKRTSLQSEELRQDRAIVDYRLGNYSVGGDLDSELLYSDHDDFFEALLAGTWTAEASGTPNTLICGVIKRSFVMEFGHLDIAQYRLFNGVTINSWDLEVKNNAIVSSKWGLMGQTMTVSGSTAAGSVVAASTNSPMDSFSGTIKEGGSTIAYVTSISLSIKANDDLAPVLGNKLSIDHFPGRFDCSGKFTAYFTDASLITKFLNETNSSLEFTLLGFPATKTLNFKLPNIKYTGAQIPISNEKGLILTMPFQAIYDSGTTTTLKMTRSNP